MWGGLAAHSCGGSRGFGRTSQEDRPHRIPVAVSRKGTAAVARPYTCAGMPCESIARLEAFQTAEPAGDGGLGKPRADAQMAGVHCAGTSAKPLPSLAM